MVVFSSAEQVISDSSKSEEVKLQEHISWIVIVMLVFSGSLVLFWRISSICRKKKNYYSYSITE